MARRAPANLLDYVPTRILEHTLETDGSVVILKPKFGTGPISRLMKRIVGRRDILRVHLDPIGSLTWESIDGRRTVGDIAEHVRDRSEDGLEDAYERCARFMRSLADAGAVRLDPPV